MVENDDAVVIAACASIIIASISAAATISTHVHTKKGNNVRRYIQHREQFSTYNTLKITCRWLGQVGLFVNSTLLAGCQSNKKVANLFQSRHVEIETTSCPTQKNLRTS